MFRNSICNNLAGSANIDGIASIHIIFYTTCNFRFLSEDDFWQGKQVLNMLRCWLDCRTVLIIPSPDQSDLCSYHPQTEVTSDHTIPRPKWPLIILLCAGNKSCNFGLGTHRVRWTWSDQRSLPDGTSTLVISYDNWIMILYHKKALFTPIWFQFLPICVANLFKFNIRSFLLLKYQDYAESILTYCLTALNRIGLHPLVI